jgi:hypothetical protein
MAGDTTARGIVRLKLETGLLPRSASGRVWAGPGANEICSACDELVTKSQRLHEWETAGTKLVMHVRCWEIWNEERLREGPTDL